MGLGRHGVVAMAGGGSSLAAFAHWSELSAGDMGLGAAWVGVAGAMLPVGVLRILFQMPCPALNARPLLLWQSALCVLSPSFRPPCLSPAFQLYRS